jgi:hypothetical protein
MAAPRILLARAWPWTMDAVFGAGGAVATSVAGSEGVVVGRRLTPRVTMGGPPPVCAKAPASAASMTVLRKRPVSAWEAGRV